MKSWIDLLKEIHELGRGVPNGPYRIVHVDDEPDLLATVADLAETSGIEVFSTRSTTDAIAYISRHNASIALVISDYLMPEVDGFQFRRLTQEARLGAPFVILSGCQDRDMALKAIDLKISGFIDKPLPEEGFAKFLNDHVLPFARELREQGELLQGFLQDATGLIDEAEQTASELERERDNAAAIHSLFGIVHTLKGASGFFEPRVLHHYVHHLENHLKRIQERGDGATPDEARAILHGLDRARVLLAGYTDPTAAGDLEALKAQLDPLFKGLAARAPAANVAAEAAHPKAEAPKQSFIRVETEIIDEFLKVSGEITIIRNMLKKTAVAIERKAWGDAEVQQLHELLDELQKANASMQRRVSDVRKVAMSSVFKPLPRVVREVSATLGKPVRLETQGGHARVDLTLAEVVNKCIIHLVKNSVDHGLETPERRRAAGKPETGVITVSAEASEDLVIVRVADDGAGLNAEKIRTKLLEKGFDPARVNQMSAHEINQMIFSPGFSTTEKTTELSGRGVGMSMVEETVRAIGGSVRVDTTVGQGSVFSLVMPVPKSVLIKNCLFVRIGSERFGVDQDQLRQVMELEGARLRVTAGQARPVLQTDDGLLPILDARELLGLSDSTAPAGQIIILQPERHPAFGLVVDEVLEFADVVIKPLAPFLKREAYLGATFLEDRRIGLLISADGLASRAGLPDRVAAPATTPKPAEAPPAWIIFEDVHGQRRAVAQSQVLRIEELPSTALSRSGELVIARYRGRALPLLTDDTAEPIRAPAENQRLTALIIHAGPLALGVRVAQIVDVVTTARPTEWPRRLMLEDGIATVLDTDQLRANFQRRYAGP